MEDIELVIKIPKAYYELVIERCKDTVLLNAFKNGTPLPKGHGRLGDLDALAHKMCMADIDHLESESEAVAGLMLRFCKKMPTIIEADNNTYELKDLEEDEIER